MKFQIDIGKIYDMDAHMSVSKRQIVISEDQRNIILLFANKKIDKDGYPIYEINGCEFSINLSFEDKPYYKQKEFVKNTYQ